MTSQQSLSYGEPYTDGPKNLLLRLLKERLLYYIEGIRTNNAEILQESYAWFTSDDDSPISFKSICITLDIPHDKLLAIVSDKSTVVKLKRALEEMPV